jgi:hypothetical protein
MKDRYNYISNYPTFPSNSRWSCTSSGMCIENNFSGEYTNLNSCLNACSNNSRFDYISSCQSCNSYPPIQPFPIYPQFQSYPIYPQFQSYPTYPTYPPYQPYIYQPYPVYTYYPQSLLYYDTNKHNKHNNHNKN